MKKTCVRQVKCWFVLKPRNSIVNCKHESFIFIIIFLFYYFLLFILLFFACFFPLVKCNWSLKKTKNLQDIKSDKAEIAFPSFLSTLRFPNDLHQTYSLENRNIAKRKQTKIHFLTLKQLCSYSRRSQPNCFYKGLLLSSSQGTLSTSFKF